MTTNIKDAHHFAVFSCLVNSQRMNWFCESDLLQKITLQFDGDKNDWPQIPYSVSKPLLLANFSVLPFSVTVRTTLSDAPAGMSASISRVTRTVEPTRPTR